MALNPFFDRIKESTTTTGTGTVTLAGAQTGFRAFSTVLATNDTCYYTIQGQTPGEWEVGLGTLTGATTLSRDTVLSSSNSGSLVSFSAGTKDVFLDFPALVIQTPGQINATMQGTNLL